MNFHYILEPYNGKHSRHQCPACKEQESFSYYIDTSTGKPLNESVGKCNREIKCAYHYPPKQFFADNDNVQPSYKRNYYPSSGTIVNPKPVNYSDLPFKDFESSLVDYDSNHFVSFLRTSFGDEITKRLIETYFIGTSQHWQSSSVFWQMDITGKLRTGKIMLYDANTGKRVKQPHNHIAWVHSSVGNDKFKLRQCFFGEHLLRDNFKPVGIVESEKTAIIASVYIPQLNWIATGGFSNFNADKCKVLAGRNVILYPDLNGFDQWSRRAEELSHLANFTTSSLLQTKASDDERARGLDLADYLLRTPLARNSPSVTIIPSTDVVGLCCETHTGKRFNNMIIVSFKMSVGRNVDILFDKYGEMISEAPSQSKVNKLSAFYEKEFVPGLFNSCECLVNLN